MVKGERRQRVSAAGEDDEPDAVACALVDEGLDDRLDGLQAVDPLAVALVVLREHRAGEVDREHQVRALLLYLALVLDDLGAGEGEDEQHEAGQCEGGGPAGRGNE